MTPTLPAGDAGATAAPESIEPRSLTWPDLTGCRRQGDPNGLEHPAATSTIRNTVEPTRTTPWREIVDTSGLNFRIRTLAVIVGTKQAGSVGAGQIHERLAGPYEATGFSSPTGFYTSQASTLAAPRSSCYPGATLGAGPESLGISSYCVLAGSPMLFNKALY